MGDNKDSKYLMRAQRQRRRLRQPEPPSSWLGTVGHHGWVPGTSAQAGIKVPCTFLPAQASKSRRKLLGRQRPVQVSKPQNAPAAPAIPGFRICTWLSDGLTRLPPGGSPEAANHAFGSRTKEVHLEVQLYALRLTMTILNS